MQDGPEIEEPPTAITDLSHDVIINIMVLLSPASILSSMCSCQTLYASATNDIVWTALLARLFGDVANVPPGHPKMAFRHLATDNFGCVHCRDTMLLDSRHRCPCVARRTKLPLRVGALGRARAGSSAPSTGGFIGLMTCLNAHFDMSDFRTNGVNGDYSLESLDRESLAPLDVLILCTTEGPALSSVEQAAVTHWVQRGGALIVSAFANWSAHGHFARETVRWLGIGTVPGTEFLPKLMHTLRADNGGAPTAPEHQAHAQRLLGCPFGFTHRFMNLGESYFVVTPEAEGGGAISLAGLGERDRHSTLVFFPPGSDGDNMVAGRGRVLVTSNLHWLCDRDKWMGGCFSTSSDNERLLLNFIAGAVAARLGVRVE